VNAPAATDEYRQAIASFKRQAAVKPAAAVRLSNEQRDDLVNALLELDVMANAAERDSVIADLRREIKHNTPRSPKAKFDVDNLVKTALKYRGGLRELIHTITGKAKGSDAWRELETLLAKLPPL
jgi:Holliday junction resolvase RusA-like endonuclease